MKSYQPKDTVMIETIREFSGVRVGKVVSVDEGGNVLVDFPGNALGPVAARFTGSTRITTLRRAATDGREALLLFENNDPNRPIILDVMHSLLDEITAQSGLVLEAQKLDDVVVDGKRIVYSAKEEIVLRCGKASVTLQKSGKIVIRGTHLVSASSGPNKIKGASVALN